MPEEAARKSAGPKDAADDDDDDNHCVSRGTGAAYQSLGDSLTFTILAANTLVGTGKNHKNGKCHYSATHIQYKTWLFLRQNVINENQR